jgi:HlyD family secretion protein
VRGQRGLVLSGATLAAAITATVAWRVAVGGPEVPTETVHRAAFSRVVRAEGTLRAVQATPLTVPADVEGSFKIAWIAEEGTRLAAGDVVFRFDPTDFENEVLDGRADQSSAAKRIEKAQAQGEVTTRNLERDATLAEHEYENARNFQSRDAEIYSRFDIISSEIDAELAQKKKEHAEAVKSTRSGLAKTELEILGIDRHKADLKVGRAEKGLGAMEMRAPHAGVLKLERNWRGIPPRVGESAWPGQKLGEIPNLARLEAEVFVLEADAGGVAAGQKVAVSVEGRGATPLPGTVRTVDALAKPRFRGVPVQYFSAVLSLDRTDEATMKPGQRVQAVIRVVDAADAVTVPRQAVVEKDGAKIVFRRGAWGRFVPVEVALGAAALGRVVVEKGLADGDVVALNDPTAAAGKTTPTPARGVGVGGAS